MDELEGLDSEDDSESGNESDVDQKSAEAKNIVSSSNENKLIDSNSGNICDFQNVKSEQSNKRTESDVNEENEDVSPAKKIRIS
jgi:hypothetical protein